MKATPKKPLRRIPVDALEPPRRRLIKGSAAAVLSSLASRPVLGVKPAQPQGYASAASTTARQHASNGRSPEAWTETTRWPQPYRAVNASESTGHAATPYHSATTRLDDTLFFGHTMLAIMQFPDDGGIRSLGRYTAAALLNARAGLTPTLNESMVRNMWNEFVSRGYFEPVAGV